MTTWYRFDCDKPDADPEPFEAKDGYVPLGIYGECPVCKCAETAVTSIGYGDNTVKCTPLPTKIPHPTLPESKWKWDYHHDQTRTHPLPEKTFRMSSTGEITYRG